MVKAILQVRRNEAAWMSMVGIPVAGLLWSLAIVYLKTDQLTAVGFRPAQAFMFVALGGLTQTIALWIGFSAVVWAMLRAFGARIPLTGIFTLTSSASLPLWVAAPAVAFCLYSDQSPAILAIAVSVLSLCVFLYKTATCLAGELSWSVLRSLAATGMAAIFLISFTFLNN